MTKLKIDTIITKCKEKFDNNSSLKWPIAFVFILGMTCFLMEFQGKPEAVAQHTSMETIDTLIPENKKLVPIQITNYEYLDHIIGQYGVVDLYTVPVSPIEKAKLLLPNTKIARAPNNPNHFHALVSETEALTIASHAGEFMVGVRNPNKVGTKIVKASRRRIIFESE